MPILARTVRFNLSRNGAPLDAEAVNTHAGWPPMIGLGAAWSLLVEVEGEPDLQTGYLVGIDVIDAAVRGSVVPWLLECWQSSSNQPPASLLPGILDRLEPALGPGLHAAELSVEPMSRFRMETALKSHVFIARRYEFSASHRLALPDADDATSRGIFGKCSNPNGHGHNYELEIEVGLPIDDAPLALTDLDRVVGAAVVDRFDHQHLNLDLPDFEGSVTSVENIAARCAELLTAPISELGGTLRRVRLWETPRTSCTVTL